MEGIKAEHFVNPKPGNGFGFVQGDPEQDTYQDIS